MKDELIRGDSAVICFSPKDDDGQVIQMSDIDTLILTARMYVDGTILFTKNKKDFTLEDDTYSVEILPENTEEIYIKTIYYDIEITLNDGTRATLLGEIDLVKDITTHKAGVVDEN